MATQLSLLQQTDEIRVVHEAIHAAEVRFDGADYDPKRDEIRLAGQMLRVFEVMKDGQWRTIRELYYDIYRRYRVEDPENSLQSQLRNLRKEHHGGHTVERMREDKGLTMYRLLVRKTQ